MFTEINLDNYHRELGAGVRLVGIGEVVRSIIRKAILSVTGAEVQQATGALQLCAAKEDGCEAAVHTMRHCSHNRTRRLSFWSTQLTHSIALIAQLPCRTSYVSVHQLPLHW